MLVPLDRERGDTRRTRLALPQPSILLITSTFMLILVFLACAPQDLGDPDGVEIHAQLSEPVQAAVDSASSSSAR